MTIGRLGARLVPVAVVAAGIAVLLWGPAAAGVTRAQVADCERGPVMSGSGSAGWRQDSRAAGPLGILRNSLRYLTRTRNGQLVGKMPVLVEGHRQVTLTVPPRERRRVFLYYGRMRDRQGKPTTLIGRSPGFSEVEFRPCADKPRTIWPGGLRVKGRRAVRLIVTVEGGADSIPLRLGRPHPVPRR